MSATRPPAHAHLLALALSLSPLSAAWAQSDGEHQPPTGARDCVVLEDPAQRLACYDELHGRSTRSPGPRLAGTPPPATASRPATPVPVTPAGRPPAGSAGGTPTGSAGLPAAGSPGQRPGVEGDGLLIHRAQPTPQGCPARSGRPLDEDWDLDLDRQAQPRPECARVLSARAYRPTYLLPFSWTTRLNTEPHSPAPLHQASTPMDLLSTEAKFQISFKTRLGQPLTGVPLTVWGGYTQSSRWQVYNGADSRPFRETNYEPEVFATWPMALDLPGGFALRMGSLSLNHQSNGRALPFSRSWNRVVAGLGLDSADQRWSVELRPWYRIPEARVDDDNPDLPDYMGRGEAVIRRLWDERQSLTLQLRHSLRTGNRSHGSALLDWAFPLNARLATTDLHGHLQLFTGYGESLVDYNLRQSRIGLGITLAGWR